MSIETKYFRAELERMVLLKYGYFDAYERAKTEICGLQSAMDKMGIPRSRIRVLQNFAIDFVFSSNEHEVPT